MGGFFIHTLFRPLCCFPPSPIRTPVVVDIFYDLSFVVKDVFGSRIYCIGIFFPVWN